MPTPLDDAPLPTMLRAIRAERGRLRTHPSDFVSIVGNRLAASGLTWDQIELVLRPADYPLRRVTAVELTPDPVTVYSGHGVTAAAMPLDLMVAGTYDGRLLAWSATSSNGDVPEVSVQAHEGRVSLVELLGGNKVLASGGQDGVLKLWSPWLRNESPIETYERHTSAITAVLLGRLVIAAGEDGSVRTWIRPSTAAPRMFVGHSAAVTRLAASSDERVLVSASDDGTLRIWDTRTGRGVAVLKGHAGPVVSCAIIDAASVSGSPRIVSASTDGLLKLWSMEGRLLRTLGGHEGPIRSLSCVDRLQLAATASDDGSVRVWDLESERVVRIIRGHREPVEHAVLHGDSPVRVLSVEGDGECRISLADSGRLLREMRISGTGRPRLSLSSTANTAACVTDDGTLCRIDLTTPEEVGMPKGALDGAGLRLFATDGRRVYLQDWEGSHAIRQLDDQDGEVEHVSANPDRNTFVSWHGSGVMRTWSRDGELLTRLQLSIVPTAVAVAPDGDGFVAGDSLGRVSVWSGLAQAPRMQAELTGGNGAVLACVWSLGGIVAIATADGRLRLWDARRGVVTLDVQAHTQPVLDCDLTFDGTTALTASTDGTVGVWDSSGTRRRLLSGHDAAVTACWIGRRTDRAVSSSLDGTVKLWDLDSGQCLGTYYNDAPVVGLRVASAAPVVAAFERGGRVVMLRCTDL